MLSNTVISEVKSMHGSEAAATDFDVPTNPMVPEKTSESQWKDQTIPSILSDAVNSKLVGGVSNGDYTMQESVASVIQSAIRIYLVLL